MKNTTEIFNQMYKGMTPVTKYTIKYGSVLIITLLLCAFYFYIRSETAARPYFYTLFYNDILFSIKECMGSVYVLPMLFETLLLAAKSGRY